MLEKIDYCENYREPQSMSAANEHFDERLPSPSLRIPVSGTIAAGAPCYIFPHEELIELSNVFLRQDKFAFRVKGAGMVNGGILNGDTVICEYRNRVKSGELIVASIDGKQKVLRSIQYNPDMTLTLIPGNDNLSPLSYHHDRIKILGAVIGVVRLDRMPTALSA